MLGLMLVEVPRPRPREKMDHGKNARHILDLLLFGKPVVLWTAFAIAVDDGDDGSEARNH